MTERPLVSVIINCYNSEKFLRETIDSLRAQTYENWEAIFWDNCSIDKTSEIIASYGDPRFRYFLAEKNTPLGEARNLAMEKVQGDLLCFLDSDDVWEASFLYDCVEGIQEAGVGLVYSRFYFFNNERKWVAASYQDSGIVPLKRLIDSYNIGMSAALIRKSVLINNSITFDNRFYLIEDFDFFIRVALQTETYYINKPLMWYRCHSNNLSHSDNWVKEMNMLSDGIDRDSYLFPYKGSISRQTDIYEFQSILQNKGKSKAFFFVIKRIWTNYKLIKYLIILLVGEGLFNQLYRFFR